LKGLIATGRKYLVCSTVYLIHEISEKTNGDGKMVHELPTYGAIFTLEM
jgi:hypothetical protein